LAKLEWNLNNSNDSKDNCKADVETDMELDNGMEDLENKERQNVSAVPNIPGLILASQKSKKQAKMKFVTFNVIEMRRNKQMQTTQDRMHRYCLLSALCCLTKNCI
jgi:hypothetical protein